MMVNGTFEITIPVLNEEKELENKFLILYDFLIGKFPNKNLWSIVIADNDSTDRTQEISKRLVKENSYIKYIRLNERGVGLALKASWSQSNTKIIGYMDLDLATDLKHIPEAISVISEHDYDIVYGTRLNKDSKVIGRTLKREISSRTLNFILRNYLGINFSDGMCGFKFLKRQVLNRLIAGGAISNGWFFSTELLVVSEWLGLKMFELPIRWTDSNDSRVEIIPLALQYIKAMKILKKKMPKNSQ